MKATGRYFVYILSNFSRILYIGMTNDLVRRIGEHQQKVNSHCFTARYNVTRLVYFEEYRLATDAIEREKKLKGISRGKKLALVSRENPRWDDLSELPGFFLSG